ncbi:hypothetical protein V8C86DRAFT_3192961 [Haematococcus lacustris]
MRAPSTGHEFYNYKGSSPAQPSPAQPSPAQPSPAQPSPAQPSPAQPSPAQPRQEEEMYLVPPTDLEGGCAAGPKALAVWAAGTATPPQAAAARAAAKPPLSPAPAPAPAPDPDPLPATLPRTTAPGPPARLSLIGLLGLKSQAPRNLLGRVSNGATKATGATRSTSSDSTAGQQGLQTAEGKAAALGKGRSKGELTPEAKAVTGHGRQARGGVGAAGGSRPAPASTAAAPGAAVPGTPSVEGEGEDEIDDEELARQVAQRMMRHRKRRQRSAV